MSSIRSNAPLPEEEPPIDAKDADRIQHTRLRKRLLGGAWRRDLTQRREELTDPTRLRIQGPGTVTRNAFKTAISQLATAYDRAPVISVEDGGTEAAEEMTRQTMAAGWQQLSIRHHRDTVGKREQLWHVDAVLDEDLDETQLVYRSISPDRVRAIARPERPDVPVRVEEWRQRFIKVTPTSRPTKVWMKDVVSIEDPDDPFMRIEMSDGRLPPEGFRFELRGDTYLQRWSWTQGRRAGRPFLPYVLTHAERTGKLFDPFEGSELVDGALDVGVLYSFFFHVVRDASWPQRWTINAAPAGAPRQDENDESATYLPLDPTSCLMLKAIGGLPASAGQWQPGADPESLLRAIDTFANSLAVDYGVKPSDIERTTGNAQSGFAVQLTQDGIKNQQRRFAPEAMRSDTKLLNKTAAILNLRGGLDLPESGWKTKLRGVAPSIAEERVEIERLDFLIQHRLISLVDAAAKVHGISRDNALDKLTQIAQDNIRFPATAPVR